MNDLIDKAIQAYAESHTSPASALLERIHRDTFAEVLKPRMLSGHLQGRLLSFLSRMIAPHRILEVGTYTGYSAICLAEGLVSGGKLVTIDINEELEERVRRYFSQAGLEGRIDFRIGDAARIIPSLTDVYDLVWLDADKRQYAAYFDMLVDKVRPGGWILADNVLWSGKVVEEKPDADTRALQAFNDKVMADPRVETLLLPIRDGIMVMRRI